MRPHMAILRIVLPPTREHKRDLHCTSTLYTHTELNFKRPLHDALHDESDNLLLLISCK